MKRAISIFLCLVMLLGILPLTAFALTGISTIKPYIPEKYLPYIGRTASLSWTSLYNANYVSTYNDQECYVTWAEWKDSNLQPVGTTRQFSADSVYILELTMKAKDGYAFTEKSTSVKYEEGRGVSYSYKNSTEATVRLWFDSIRVYTSEELYYSSNPEYWGEIPLVTGPIPTDDMTFEEFEAQVKLNAEDSKYSPWKTSMS